ncbi:MAG: hypothetical protein V1702_06480 [Candidatus Woesearchaeota archaeon]
MDRLCIGLERIVHALSSFGEALTVISDHFEDTSRGLGEHYDYEIGGERIKLRRLSKIAWLTVWKPEEADSFVYRKVFVCEKDSKVVSYSIDDATSKRTYHAKSSEPLDKAVITVAQQEYKAYLEKIREIELSKMTQMQVLGDKR